MACDYGSASTRVSIEGQDIILGFDFDRNWQDCQLGFHCTIRNSKEFFNELIDDFSDTLDYPWDEFIITLPADIDPNEVVVDCRVEKSDITVKKTIPSPPAAKRLTTKQELVLKADKHGGYQVMGKINGRKVNFIVDTGASLVSLSKNTARKLRLKYGKNRPVKMQTASGIDLAYLTTIKKISIGKIIVYDIKAVISTHDYPRYPLLGMSVLSKLELIQQDNIMILRKKP